LIQCVTQAGYEVLAGESYRHEKLDVSDWTAAPEVNEDDSEDGKDGHDVSDCGDEDIL